MRACVCTHMFVRAYGGDYSYRFNHTFVSLSIHGSLSENGNHADFQIDDIGASQKTGGNKKN